MAWKKHSRHHFFAIACFCQLQLCIAAQQTTLKGADFPVLQIVLIAIAAVVISSVIGALVAWKSDSVEHALETGFEKAGAIVGAHPVKVISATVVFALICGGGFALQEAELDPAVLWVPAGALALDHRDYVDSRWPASAYPEFLIVLPASGSVGENMLTPATIQALFRDYSAFMATVTNGDAVVSLNDNKHANLYQGQWTYSGTSSSRRKCYLTGGDCFQQSILAVFGYDAALINGLTSSTILSRIDQWESTPKNSLVPGSNIWKSFELNTTLGGITRDSNNRIVGATLLKVVWYSSFEAKEVKYYDKGSKGLQDPIMMLAGSETVCLLGLVKESPIDENTKCSKPAGVKYTGNLARSFADEFGETIKDDISKVIIAYYLMIGYLFLNLGKRDSVHTMQIMSGVCLGCIGFAYFASAGLGGYFQVRTNPLNNNIPFLLLGLGVDDSFVLASEFIRHSVEHPELSIADRIAKTAQTGGLSVLVTSVTDALAFLLGASTVLPALSAFCVYAGFGVIFCFIFEMLIFLPALALNARRTEANRYEYFCCIEAPTKHDLKDPKGCCICIPGFAAIQPGDMLLARGLEKFGQKTILWLPGKIITLFVFFVVFVLGIIGVSQMKANFKIEWFFPEDSYVKEYLELNDKYFSVGTSFDVYVTDYDIFQKQGAFNELSDYLRVQDFLRQETIQDWWWDYNAGASPKTDAAQFWAALWTSYQSSRYQASIKWKDADCNIQSQWANCNPAAGISDSKIRVTMKTFEDGAKRYKIMNTLREDIKNMFGDKDGKKAFPYSYAFLFWEEIGVIAEELVRNLIIAAGIVAMIICMLIPDLRIATVVALNIVIAIVEVVGFSHYWGLTFNGISTIYFLICMGLAVDYSAHVAHTFKAITGVPNSERAVIALKRIGPSVVHALTSTILAVIVLCFSKSFVFEVFYKILMLVTFIAGSHGVWLLPVLLSLLPDDAARIVPYNGSEEAQTAAMTEAKVEEAGDAITVMSSSTKDDDVAGA